MKSYFREQFAIYFALLAFYTERLPPATILAVTMFLVQFFSKALLSTIFGYLMLRIATDYVTSVAYFTNRKKNWNFPAQNSSCFLRRFGPTAGHLVRINVPKIVCKYVATWLTDKKHHPLQTAYEFHMETSVQFRQLPCPVFYLSFWIQDLAPLGSRLAPQPVTNSDNRTVS